MDAMDIAGDLVETYLRLNGYPTMGEFEIQRRGENGLYETVTDVDIVGFRLPGDMDAADEQEVAGCCSFPIRPWSCLPT
jgi:hypothetical protein